MLINYHASGSIMYVEVRLSFRAKKIGVSVEKPDGVVIVQKYASSTR